MPVTIRDVARQTAVSTATVSHVINGTRPVDGATAERVRVAIAALGYRPNHVARSMRRGVTHTLGLLVPDNSNPFFAEVARAIEDASFARGYSVVLCNSDDSEDKEATYVDLLLSKQVDGLILISSGRRASHLRTAISVDVPFVVVDRKLPGLVVDEVCVDNAHGGRLAARHLLSLGHRRIGLIAGLEGVAPSDDRRRGFEQALRRHGVVLDESAVVVSDFRYTGGEQAMQELLRRDLGITAVFAANDLMAIGALRALHTAGCAVPADVSVMGFDDIQLAEAFAPALTTIAQPVAALGQTTVDVVLERIREPGADRRTVVLRSRLVVRQSTAPPS